MRLAFLCSGLEPGRDGVGDYTRALAGALAARGHAVRLAALRDAGAPASADAAAPALRLRDVFQSRAERAAVTRWLAEFSPDWVSVQFTPFGFHPRGLGGERAAQLRALLPPDARRHLMLHEIWLQPGAGGRWRDRALGLLQRRSVDAWLGAGWRPAVIHTQARLHQQRLRARGARVKILPLFTAFRDPGVEQAQARCATAAWIRVRAGDADVPTDDRACWIGHFGSFHAAGWDFAGFAQGWARGLAARGRRACFLALGRSAAAQQAWSAARARAPEGFFYAAGEVAEEFVPVALAACDAAFTSTPLDVVEKSSAVAAWRALGVPVLAPRAGATPPGALPPWPDAGIFPAPAGTDFAPSRVPPPSFVLPARAAEQFLADLASP